MLHAREYRSEISAVSLEARTDFLRARSWQRRLQLVVSKTVRCEYIATNLYFAKNSANMSPGGRVKCEHCTHQVDSIDEKQ